MSCGPVQSGIRIERLPASLQAAAHGADRDRTGVVSFHEVFFSALEEKTRAELYKAMNAAYLQLGWDKDVPRSQSLTVPKTPFKPCP